MCQDMLEGSDYLVSRDLPSSCEQESQWIYNASHVIEHSKRTMEDGEDSGVRKVHRQLEAHEREQATKGLHDISLMSVNQQHHSRDYSDSNLLIHQLGREISISCLLRCSRADYGRIASVNKGFWSLIRNSELYRLRREMGIVEHWIYFSCQLLEWEAFDPIRHRWMKLPKMASNECFRCSDKESLAVGTELLVFGKEIHSHVVFRYSITTHTWSSWKQMNAPRCLFGSASLGEIAIIAGGCDASGNILSSAELYNSVTGEWETLPNMNKARKMSSAVFIDGKFYVMGGIGVGNTKMLTSGEVFDLKTKTWSEIPNMFPERNRGSGANEVYAATEAPPLLAVVNNVLYAANSAERDVRRYNKETNSWVSLGPLPERTVSMNGWGLAFRACGERVIVVGGPQAPGTGTIEIHSWKPSEGPPKWTLLASKPSGSFVYNCAVMGC